MKLMPAPRARPTIREEVASSVGPPNIIVPRQIGEIFRPLRPSWRYCIRFLSSASSSTRGADPSLALQYLEHAVGHGDDALVDGYLGCDEDQASRRAYHARPRNQHFADLAGLDEMGIELHGRERRFSRDVAGGHAAGAVGEGP